MNRSMTIFRHVGLGTVLVACITPIAAQTTLPPIATQQLTVSAPDKSTDTTPTISGTTTAAVYTPVMLYVFDDNKGQYLSTTVRADGTFSLDVLQALSVGTYQTCAMIQLKNTDAPQMMNLRQPRADMPLGCPWSNSLNRLVANDAGSIVAAPATTTAQTRSVPVLGLPALLLMAGSLLLLASCRLATRLAE